MPTSPATNKRPPAEGRRSAALKNRDGRGGFTLMEMVLALAIIGLIAALGLPFSRPNAGVAALRMKTFEIVAMLRADRNAALRSGRMATILIDADMQTIQSGTSQARVQIPRSMQVRIAPAGLPGFRFFADGRAYGGRLTVSSGKTAFVVDVNSLTAAVDASAQ